MPYRYKILRGLDFLFHLYTCIRFTCCTCTVGISKVLIFVGKKLHMKSAKLNTLSTCLVIVILALQYFLCIHEFFYYSVCNVYCTIIVYMFNVGIWRFFKDIGLWSIRLSDTHRVRERREREREVKVDT